MLIQLPLTEVDTLSCDPFAVLRPDDIHLLWLQYILLIDSAVNRLTPVFCLLICEVVWDHLPACREEATIYANFIPSSVVFDRNPNRYGAGHVRKAILRYLQDGRLCTRVGINLSDSSQALVDSPNSFSIFRSIALHDLVVGSRQLLLWGNNIDCRFAFRS